MQPCVLLLRVACAVACERCYVAPGSSWALYPGGDAAKGAKKAAPGKKPKEVAPTMEGLDADMDDYFKDEEKVAAAPEAAEAAATEAPMEEAAASEASAE